MTELFHTYKPIPNSAVAPKIISGGLFATDPHQNAVVLVFYLLTGNCMEIISTPCCAPDRIPTREECDDLMVKYSMLPNIIAHSRQVMRVSLAITDHLKKEASVNRDLVLAAALLHDITKTRALQSKEKHDRSGGELLEALGFASVGEIVRQHVALTDFKPEGRLQEHEIVNYADKRVMHDRIVSLPERMKDLIKRYGITEEIRLLIRKNGDQVLAVEKKIMNCMAVPLETVIEKLL